MPEKYKFEKKSTPSAPSTRFKFESKSTGKKIAPASSSFLDYVPDVIRGVAGFSPGGPAGFLINAGAEGLARAVAGQPVSLPAMGAAGAFGAIPFSGIVGPARAALRGFGASAGQALAMPQAEKGLHVPTPEEIGGSLVSGTVGGVAGGAAAKYLPEVLPKIFGKGETPNVKIEESAIKVEPPTAAPVTPTTTIPVAEKIIQLPPELAKASPTSGSWRPAFDNDLDKALFIVNKGTNRNHEKYMDFLRENTGLNDKAIFKAASTVNENMKSFFSKQAEKGGSIDLPKMHKLNTTKLTSGTQIKVSTGTTPPPPTPPGEPPPVTAAPEPTPSVKIDEQAPTVQSPAENARTILDYARQAPSELRQLMTWGDLSFPFRQGITNIHRPKEFWGNWKSMIQALAKEGQYERIEAEISAMPRHDKMMSSGLDIHDPSKGITNREENLRGVILENIGDIGKYKFKKWNPIRRTNQAYAGFAHKLRADVFNSIADNAEKAGIVLDDDAYRAISNFVNDTTGRGKLGKFERHAPLLNEFLFAPKLIASRVNMFRRLLPGKKVLGTKWDDKAEKFVPLKLDPKLESQLRMEAVKSMASVGALASVVGGTSALALKENSVMDVTSPDFGKFKSGPTRIDVTGGFQPYVRTAVLVAKELADVEGKTRQTAGDVAGRFARNKLSPAASLIADWWYESTPIGERFETKNAFLSRVTPLIAQDLYKIATRDKGMLPLAGSLSALGASTGVYGKDKPKRGAPNIRVNLP